MDNKYILFFDDVRGLLPFHQLKVLRYNSDGTFSFGNLPIVMPPRMSNYQEQVGTMVYILDCDKDSNIISRYSSKVKIMEAISDDKYNLVSLYVSGSSNDDRGIDKLVYLKKNSTDSINNEVFVLKPNSDGTVSIENAPIVVKGSFLDYSVSRNCFMVSVVNESEEANYEGELFELKETSTQGKYDLVRCYEKGKVKVKM